MGRNGSYLSTATGMSLKANLLAPLKFSETAALTNTLTAASCKILSQNHPAKSVQIPDPQKLCEIIMFAVLSC